MTLGSKVDSPVISGGTVEVTQTTHDNLNANANIQVDDVDVSGDNQVPVRKEIAEFVATPVISNGAAYLAGDAVGGVMEFANAVKAAGGTGVVTKVRITDEDGQSAPLDLIFFNEAPAAAPADNDPYGLTDADLELTAGFVDVAATDYVAFANNSLATKGAGLRMPFEFVLAAGETSLRSQLRTGGTPTYGATDALIVTLTIEQHE